jgi:hypothetical protein
MVLKANILKTLTAERVPDGHVTTGSSLVIVEAAEQIFVKDDAAKALDRVLQVLSWTDWNANLEHRHGQYCGLVVCFPRTEIFDTRPGSLERVTIEAFRLAALTLDLQLSIRLHNLQQKPEVDDLSKEASLKKRVSLDFVFNRSDPVISYPQALNRVLYRQFGLLFKLREDTFVLPSQAFDSGYVLREPMVRNPFIQSVYLLDPTAVGIVTAKAYGLANPDGSYPGSRTERDKKIRTYE